MPNNVDDDPNNISYVWFQTLIILATMAELFAEVSKIDHAGWPQRDHTCLMVSSNVKALTSEEFASLLVIGNSRVTDPAPVITAEHSAKLIVLGYIVDIAGRLRMTTPGRTSIREQTDPKMSHPTSTA